MLPMKLLSFISLVVVLAVVICAAPAWSQTPVGEPWTMYHIHDGYLIANSLDAADVNHDGFDDYSVIDEGKGLQTIVFHPGPNGDVRKAWPRVVLGKTGNPEYSCLGDLDGDGNLDVVVVEGDDMEKGIPTGVRIWWGPTSDKVMDPDAWTNSGHIPGTEGEQYLFCLVRDLNGDGRGQILVGGRKHPLTKKYAGIRIISPPKDGDRRDLKRWTTRHVDPEALSGHGLVTADVNGNGLLDILNADADWDTPKFEQTLAWYENPGSDAGPDQPWKKHAIWRSPAFYAKPQIAVGDLDGDGLADLATQTHNFIHVFRKTIEGGQVKFTRTDVRKPEWCQWLGRPIKMADLDGDGKLEIVAALIHHDGLLPADKASVFMMKQTGDPFSPDGWSFHPIKWSDGANTYHQWTGEKWDHLLFADVDGDGVLDIVGNVEEHYRREPGRMYETIFSVVWFENPLKPAGRGKAQAEAVEEVGR